MAKVTEDNRSDPSDTELKRVAEQIAARLRARGVTVEHTDSADDLGSLLEAVERFEMAVEARGGDLMVDEPPEGQPADPDNENFVLPTRKANENAAAFTQRIVHAASQLRS